MASSNGKNSDSKKGRGAKGPETKKGHGGKKGRAKLDAGAAPAASADRGPDLGILLAVTYRCAIDQLTARLTEAGFPDLRPPDGYTFRALGETGRTSTELAAMLGISKQAANKIVDHMEARGLVARHIVPGDRRAKTVRLTERGQLAMQTAISINRQIEAEFAAQIGAGPVATMRAALIRFADAYGGRDDARAGRARPVW